MVFGDFDQLIESMEYHSKNTFILSNHKTASDFFP